MKHILPVLLLSLTACSGVRSSVVRTGAAQAAYRGPVRVQSVGIPKGKELGLVQVRGARPIEDLVPEFKEQVAALGGDVGVVDSVKSRFEMQTQNQTYTYGCGTSTAPRTCTGTRQVRVEVMTVQLLGRAFRQ